MGGVVVVYDKRGGTNSKRNDWADYQIKELMLCYKHKLRDNYKFYSQDLLNNLFKHPYTKIEFVVNDLGVSRLTAANYLNKLADDKMLRKEKLGTGNYYINDALFSLLKNR